MSGRRAARTRACARSIARRSECPAVTHPARPTTSCDALSVLTSYVKAPRGDIMPFAARHVPARRARTLAPFTVASPRRPEIALFRRIAAVTLALSAIGAVVGAALGMLALWGLSIAVGNPRAVELIGGAGDFVAILGAVLAPVAAWTLMRAP